MDDELTVIILWYDGFFHKILSCLGFIHMTQKSQSLNQINVSIIMFRVQHHASQISSAPGHSHRLIAVVGPSTPRPPAPPYPPTPSN